jgi:hypothetical protein
MFERRRVVLVGGIDDLSGTARAGALGEALNAAEQRRSSLENADVGASREDLAFSPNQQRL